MKKNTTNRALLTAAWVLSMAIVTFGPRFIWSGNELVTVIGIGLKALLGVGMIFANIRHLKGLDDLQRKSNWKAWPLL